MNGPVVVSGFDIYCTSSSFCVNLPDDMLRFLTLLSTSQKRLLWGAIRLKEADNSAWRSAANELWLTLRPSQKEVATQLWVDGRFRGAAHDESDLEAPEEDVDLDVDTDIIEDVDVETESIEEVVKFLATLVS